MAAPTMEVRPAPAGVGVFAHRGPRDLVRLLPSSKFLAVVNDCAFTVDPSDAADLDTNRLANGDLFDDWGVRLASSCVETSLRLLRSL